MSGSDSYRAGAVHPDGATAVPIVRYRPSGSVGPLSIPVGLLFGLAVVGALAFLYHWLMNAIPLVYVNALITVGYAVLVGLAAGLGLRLGQCRNSAIAVFIGLACGLAAFFVPMALEFDSVEHFDAVAETGWEIGTLSSSGGIPIQGFFVYVVFGIQLLGMLGVAAGIAYVMSAGTPYCENCRRYTTSAALGSIPEVDDEAVRASVKAGNLLPLIRVPRKAGSGAALEYALDSCPTCGRQKHLTVKMKRTVRKGKKREEQSTDLLDNVVISDQLLGELSGAEGFIQSAEAGAKRTESGRIVLR